MPKVERERKFLLRSDAWRKNAAGVSIRQAYLSTDPDCTIRVRSMDDRAYLTIKGRAHGAHGALRAELEYEIPSSDVDQLFSLAKTPPVEKRRHRIDHRGAVWEVDEFDGENAGLVLAEIEVEDAGALERAVEQRPEWIGREVTSDHRFSNSNLAQRPFRSWPEAERNEITNG